MRDFAFFADWANGVLDHLFPIENSFLLLRSGTAKDAWINPAGIHMGRQDGVWSNARITEEVLRPWIFRHLGIVMSVRETAGR